MPVHTTLSRVMGPEPEPNVLSMPRTGEPGLKRQKIMCHNYIIRSMVTQTKPLKDPKEHAKTKMSQH